MDERALALHRVISSIGDLPALPDVVARVLDITEDPSAAMSSISDSIQDDPALTAKILKISNSPYYGMRQYVGTLKLALVILGVREIRNIVLGISVFEALSSENLDSPLVKDFWTHSVRVGGVCKRLGSTIALGLQGEDFISGLLHDMGKMAMARQLGASYMRIFNKAGGFSDSLCELERVTFGFDHADVAAALASCWNLPKTLADAMWCHHSTPERMLSEAKDPRLAALVRIANRAAREDFSDPEGEPEASCLDEDAWMQLSSPFTPGTPSGRREMLARFMAEFDECAQIEI
jgi:HD-like signal output (HDOD) protein